MVNIHDTDGTVKVGQHMARTVSSPLSLNLKDCPERSTARRKQCNNARNDMEIDESGSKVESVCFSSNVSNPHIMDASIENSEKATINGGYNEYPTKKRSDRSLCLNSMSSNTVEAAIIDLEELMNRIKWLKSVLNLRVLVYQILNNLLGSFRNIMHHTNDCYVINV